MFRVLASVLLLGLFPSAIAAPELSTLPGFELLSVASPTPIDHFSAPSLSASGAMMIDLDSGQEIFGVSENSRRPIGSLTKIMTALIILEEHDLNERVVVPTLPEIEGSKIGIQAGQSFTVHDLLKALLIPSANDVAYALAIFDAGSASAFVEKMNARAEALGLVNTHFDNPAGFDGAAQFGTPRDLAWLSAAALRKTAFRSIVNTTFTTVTSLEGIEFPLTNTNELLRTKKNVEGVKTGTTSGAGQCLITLFTEGNRTYLLVLLGSAARFSDATRVMQSVSADIL